MNEKSADSAELEKKAARLRSLRLRTGLSQLEVELAAELGTGYLQRVENGKVSRPERETLERILRAVKATYPERQEILSTYGYAIRSSLPDKTEADWAVTTCRPELDSAPFPAYLLDCGVNLLAYNRLFPKLLEGSPVAYLASALPGRSMLESWFDRQQGLGLLLNNPAEYYPAMVQALKFELQFFPGEEWTAELIARLSRNWPPFAELWQKTRWGAVAGRVLLVLELNHALEGLLRLRLASENFIYDRRFRLIYLIPADEKTLGLFEQWSTSY